MSRYVCVDLDDDRLRNDLAYAIMRALGNSGTVNSACERADAALGVLASAGTPAQLDTQTRRAFGPVVARRLVTPWAWVSTVNDDEPTS